MIGSADCHHSDLHGGRNQAGMEPKFPILIQLPYDGISRPKCETPLWLLKTESCSPGLRIHSPAAVESLNPTGAAWSRRQQTFQFF